MLVQNTFQKTCKDKNVHFAYKYPLILFSPVGVIRLTSLALPVNLTDLVFL